MASADLATLKGGYDLPTSVANKIAVTQYTHSDPWPQSTSTPAATPAAAPAYVDPYASYGGTDAYNRLVSDYGASKDATYGSITDRIGSEGEGYNSGILDFLDSTKAGQNSINSKSVQNELSKRQGSAGVLDMVGRGIRSGGVVLANKNATSSSATEALARAYGDIGRREQTGVNNQYEQGESSIQDSQDALELQKATGLRHLTENKTKIVNGIVTDAQNALATLNQQAATASLPDRIDIESEKQRIRNDALGKLQEYDQALSTGLGGITASDSNTNKTKAAALDTAGTTADNAFNYTSEVPAQYQDTGPFASQLPIFTFPTNKKTQTA